MAPPPIPPLAFGQAYLIYDPQTGSPKYTVDFPAPAGLTDLFVQNQEYVAVMNAADSISEVFVLNGEVVARPVPNIRWRGGKYVIAADMVDSCWLDGVPPGATVIVDGQQVTVVDGSIQLGADTPGTYNVTVTGWPYMEWSGIFIAE